MAQNPTIPPTEVISVPSSTVGPPNTQDTLNYQQQVENYTGPSLIHEHSRTEHEVMSPRPEDVTGHGDPTAGYTAQSTMAPSAIPVFFVEFSQITKDARFPF
eukprot:3814970-Amphidinium_carterae.1